MKQRGRKSSTVVAKVATVSVDKFLSPPETLDRREQKIWAHVVATKPMDWWDAGSTPLLEQYCAVVVQSQTIAEHIKQCEAALANDPDQLETYKTLSALQKGLTNQIIALARSMRLTQQARYGTRTAARKSASTTRKPWQITET